MTKAKALKLAESKFWEDMSFQERVAFQLFEDRLCMPFDVFHEAVEKALGRPVWTHEFTRTNQKNLQDEFKGLREPMTFQEVVGLIPEEKRILFIGR